MPVTRNSAVQVLLKGLGTLVLALGFIALIGRVPFVPESSYKTQAAADSIRQPGHLLPALQIDTGFIRGEPESRSEPDSPTVLDPLQPPMGLFKASFAATETSPGFTTAEERVPGECQGAGRRYVDMVCANCELLSSDSKTDPLSMLVWNQYDSGETFSNGVTPDCISVAADGVPVVGVLRFGGNTAALTEGGEQSLASNVPLIAGATRAAEFEVGGWIATLDNVARPSTALTDMALELRNRGWREVSEPPNDYRPAFEGERVFVNSAGVHFVISLSRQDRTHQLISIVSAGPRG